MLKVSDTVKILRGHMGDHVKCGDLGTIVFCFTQPTEGYEVEFLDDEGYTKAVLTLEPGDIEIVPF